MHSCALLFLLGTSFYHSLVYCQSDFRVRNNSSNDSLGLRNALQESGLFNVFTSGITANNQKKGNTTSIDLAVQTYHYFLVTGKRFQNDSIHQLMLQKKQLPARELYRGFDFYLLSRAALDLDTLKAIANDYVSSLQASPLTIRLSKKIYLSSKHELLENDYSPVFALNIISDIRAVPFNDLMGVMQLGVSGHLYFSFSSIFKRMEFDSKGNEIDKGSMYFQPALGIAAGTRSMFNTLLRKPGERIILSSECRLGFVSDKNSVKDCALLVRYALSDIIGPKLRVGILLSSFK